MIEFNGKAIRKLHHAEKLDKLADAVLLDGEEIVETYKNAKTCVIFTTERALVYVLKVSNDKSITFTAIPYSQVIVCDYTINLIKDVGGAIELFVSNLGKVRFEFDGKTSIKLIARAISDKIDSK